MQPVHGHASQPHLQAARSIYLIEATAGVAAGCGRSGSAVRRTAGLLVEVVSSSRRHSLGGQSAPEAAGVSLVVCTSSAGQGGRDEAEEAKLVLTASLGDSCTSGQGVEVDCVHRRARPCQVAHRTSSRGGPDQQRTWQGASARSHLWCRCEAHEAGVAPFPAGGGRRDAAPHPRERQNHLQILNAQPASEPAEVLRELQQCESPCGWICQAM